MSDYIRVGIVFNLVVCLIIAVISLGFFIFLIRKWKGLPLVLRSYTWFWFFTMLVWIGVSIRYIFISFAPGSNFFVVNEFFLKSITFLSGAPLFFYIGLRVFKSTYISATLTFFSFVSSLTAIYFLFLPGGISEPIITEYSADTLLNDGSLLIFQVNIGIIFLLLIYHILQKIRVWYKIGESKDLYRALYSISLLVYVCLGAIDQLKLFIDWKLIIFRILYAAAFLMAYLIIVQDEESREEYFLEK